MIINVDKFPWLAWINDVIGFFYDVFMWLSRTLSLPYNELFTSEEIIYNPFTFNLSYVGFKGVFTFNKEDIFGNALKGIFDSIFEFFTTPLKTIFGYNIDDIPVFVVLISSIFIVLIFLSLVKTVVNFIK